MALENITTQNPEADPFFLSCEKGLFRAEAWSSTISPKKIKSYKFN